MYQEIERLRNNLNKALEALGYPEEHWDEDDFNDCVWETKEDIEVGDSISTGGLKFTRLPHSVKISIDDYELVSDDLYSDDAEFGVEEGPTPFFDAKEWLEHYDKSESGMSKDSLERSLSTPGSLYSAFVFIDTPEGDEYWREEAMKESLSIEAALKVHAIIKELN